MYTLNICTRKSLTNKEELCRIPSCLSAEPNSNNIILYLLLYILRISGITAVILSSPATFVSYRFQIAIRRNFFFFRCLCQITELEKELGGYSFYFIIWVRSYWMIKELLLIYVSTKQSYNISHKRSDLKRTAKIIPTLSNVIQIKKSLFLSRCSLISFQELCLLYLLSHTHIVVVDKPVIFTRQQLRLLHNGLLENCECWYM